MNKAELEAEIRFRNLQIKELENVILVLEGDPAVYEPKIVEIQEQIQVFKQELAKF